MKKIIVLAASILVSGAALAQNFSFTNNNPVGGSSIYVSMSCNAGTATVGTILPQKEGSINNGSFTKCALGKPVTILLGGKACTSINYANDETSVWYDISGDGSKYPYQCVARSAS
jgi:hypothetical protein